MRLKRISNTLYLLLLTASIVLIAGCTKKIGTEEPPELKLSTPGETVSTDAIEYSFDIVSGAGDYHVEIADDGQPALGKATLTGTRVKVELITQYTQVTVTDKSNRKADLLIVSSHPSIQIMNYLVSVLYGNFHKLTMDWGAGKYSIYRQSGDAAELSIDNNDQITIKPRKPGRAYFTIMDRRGTTNGISVIVEKGWDLTGKELSVTVEAGHYYTFPLKYGEGGWKITHRSSPLLHNPQTCVMPKDPEYREQDMLHVWVPEEVNEPLSLQLTDKAGNTATITIVAQKTSPD